MEPYVGGLPLPTALMISSAASPSTLAVASRTPPLKLAEKASQLARRTDERPSNTRTSGSDPAPLPVTRSASPSPSKLPAATKTSPRKLLPKALKLAMRAKLAPSKTRTRLLPVSRPAMISAWSYSLVASTPN